MNIVQAFPLCTLIYVAYVRLLSSFLNDSGLFQGLKGKAARMAGAEWAKEMGGEVSISRRPVKAVGFIFRAVTNHQSGGSQPYWAHWPLLMTFHSAFLTVLKWNAEMTLPNLSLTWLLCYCLINYPKALWLKTTMLYYFCGPTGQLFSWCHLDALMCLLLAGDQARREGPGGAHSRLGPWCWLLAGTLCFSSTWLSSFGRSDELLHSPGVSGQSSKKGRAEM